MTVLRPVLFIPLSAALLLAGCDTMGQRQAAGTGVGAAAGGLLGGLLSKNAGGAAVGAVAGGIIGGAIGQELDKQAGELRAGFGDNRIGVVNTGKSLVVTMPQDILFATGSARLSGGLTADLRVLAAHLKKYPNSTVQVIGHTDNVGAAAYNLNLSRQRAAAVSGVLVSNGVPASRLATVGRGEDQPVASNLTAAGRAQNRRVEIIILPNV
ncbi:MAG: hypothetical protein CR993_06995 [Rhodobacterales bacterium]|nr:MAG: hypothetical protein CR993_06995 [Rhodobacterales bacterium]